jgi:hypothetical protein
LKNLTDKVPPDKKVSAENSDVKPTVSTTSMAKDSGKQHIM